jgi:uncharacterized Zn finger protein
MRTLTCLSITIALLALPLAQNLRPTSNALETEVKRELNEAAEADRDVNFAEAQARAERAVQLDPQNKTAPCRPLDSLIGEGLITEAAVSRDVTWCRSKEAEQVLARASQNKDSWSGSRSENSYCVQDLKPRYSKQLSQRLIDTTNRPCVRFGCYMFPA